MASRRPGARERRDKLVTDHLQIVEPIARYLAQQIPASFDTEDLVGAGTIALVQAAKRYKPSEHGGAPFGAYARFRVRGAMLDSIRRQNWDRAKRTESLDQLLTAEYDELGKPVNSGRICQALDQLMQQPSTDGDVDQARLLKRVAAAVAELPERLRSVIELHYSREMSLVDVSELFSIHRSRASHLHMEAIRELRTRLGIRA